MNKIAQNGYTGLNNSKTKFDTKNPLLFWLLIGLTTIFLFVAPFQRALFNGATSEFDGPIFTFLLIGSFTLLLCSLYCFFYWKPRGRQDWLVIAAWCVPLCFLLSKINAVSSYTSSNLLYLNVMYVTTFIVGAMVATQKLGNVWLQTAVTVSGYVVVLFGFLNLFGNANYHHAVMMEGGMRLTSVFQYANTYASYLIAFTLVALFLATIAKKWYMAAVNSFMLVPILLSFFLTLSRGAFLILPIALVLILPFMRLSRQVIFIVNFVIALAISIALVNPISVISNQIQSHFSASLSVKGWAILFAASLICAVVSVIMHRFVPDFLETKLHKYTQRRFSQLIIPVVATVLGMTGAYIVFVNRSLISIFPINIQQRLYSINLQEHSILERIAFHKDGFKMFQDYPIIGAGGGAWMTIYQQYQSYPYISRQAHNSFLQYVLDVGLIGFVVWLAVLASVYYLFIKNHFKQRTDHPESRVIFYIVGTALLLHSVMDFDMSFVYVQAVVFLCLGGMLSGVIKPGSPGSSAAAPLLRWSKPYAVAIAAISVIMIIISFRLVSANSNFAATMDALKTQKPYNEIIAPLDRAIKLVPNQPEYALTKISIFESVHEQTKDAKFYEQATEMLKQIKQTAPGDKQIFEAEYKHLLTMDQVGPALALMDEAVKKYPWDISVYDRSIALSLTLGDRARQAGDKKTMNEHFEKAIAAYKLMQAKQYELSLLPKEQFQGQFAVSRNMALSLGQVYYIRGEYKAASDVLKMGLSDKLDTPASRDVARWYLASLVKQNSVDSAVHDKLVQADPQEADHVQQLAATEF